MTDIHTEVLPRSVLMHFGASYFSCSVKSEVITAINDVFHVMIF